MNIIKAKFHYFHVLVCFLILLGGGFTLYQHLVLEMPWQENKEKFIWSIEAMVRFRAKEGIPVKVSLEIPSVEGADFMILRENFISRHYGYTVQPKNNKRYVIWSIRRTKGIQTLYYRVNLYKYDNINEAREIKKQKLPIVQQSLLTDITDAERLTMEVLLDSIRSHSSDIATFTSKAIQTLNEQTNKKVRSLLGEKEQPEKVATYIIKLLAMANIPASMVYGIELKEGINVQPSIWIRSFNGHKWLYFNALTGIEGLPNNIFPWGSDMSMVNIEGGRQQKLRFSVSKEITNAMNLALDMGKKLHFKSISFSLFSLPLQIQQVYHVLFLVPIGVFVILLLRIFIGLETIGTFMPVLIALAFRDTQLVGGIILFVFITAIGLLLRANLEQIKLLIVPKLAVILTAVIMLIAIISIISHKLDIECGLSVALFPMVILTMTIEKLSILWEERGGTAALKIGVSSVFAASITYMIMSIHCIHYLFFAFPGLLLILMAIMLVCGRYRGYRLLELLRFREFLLR